MNRRTGRAWGCISSHGIDIKFLWIALALVSSGCGTVNSTNHNQSSSLTVSVKSPASGATVSGTISVVASPSATASSVQFLVDAKNVGTAVTSAPFTYALNTTTLSNGSHSLTAMASSSAGQTATSAAVSITVNNSHLQITTSTLPAGQVGISYSATVQAANGTAPYTWSISGGQLPGGLSFSAAGVLSGTPTAKGTFSVDVKVTDSTGAAVSATLSLTSPPLRPRRPARLSGT